jgi:hypothetical protein
LLTVLGRRYVRLAFQLWELGLRIRRDEMSPKPGITSDMGSGVRIDPEIAHAAARVVALKSMNTGDALLLLDMLGLIPTQPGFEPVDLSKSKSRRYYEASKESGQYDAHNEKRRARREEAKRKRQLDKRTDTP